MSATEQLLERVKTLDETQAQTLLDLINNLPAPRDVPPTQVDRPKGAAAMLGYARKYNHELKTTEEWMKELRGGEQEV